MDYVAIISSVAEFPQLKLHTPFAALETLLGIIQPGIMMFQQKMTSSV